MNRSSAEVEAEVEASRNQLDRNVEALKEKMTPGQLLDQAMHMMGGAGQQVGAKFLDQAKENPMPLAVMGLGLAWLMSSNSKPKVSAPAEPRSFSAYPGGADGGGGSMGDYAPEGGGLVDSLKDKAHDIGAHASDALASAQDKLSAAGSSAAGGLGAAGDRAGQMAQQAQQTILQVFDKEPLVGGALGLFVGLAIGAALPSTEAEDHLLGPMHDRVVEKGKDLAQAGLEQAGSAAQAAYSSAKSEFGAEGHEGLTEKVASAVKSGVDSAQEALNRPH